MIIVANEEEKGIMYLNVFEVDHKCRTDANALTEIKRQIKAYFKNVDPTIPDDFNWGDLSSWEKVFEWQHPIISVVEKFSGSGISVEIDEVLLGGSDD